MKYRLGFLISILCLTACTEEKTVKIKDSSDDREAREKQAVLAAYQVTNPLINDDLWDTDAINRVINMKGANWYDYSQYWERLLKDEEQILKIRAKVGIATNYRLGHEAAFFVKKLTGQKISLPNIHLDSLDDKINTKNLVSNLKKNWLDVMDAAVAKEDVVKRNVMTEELFQNFKPFFSLWNTCLRHCGDEFPLIYRDERTFRSVWNQVKPILFKEITKQQFEKLRGGFYVNTLLTTYNMPELHKKCRETIASKQELSSEDERNCENTDIAYSTLMTKAYRDQFQSPGENQEKELGGYLCQFRTWFFSFWLRRHIEGTDQMAHQILVEIQEHYK